MSEWKDDDEVTTTYGSIQLSLHQAHAAGQKTERKRIIKLLNEIWPDYPPIEDLIAEIEGDTDD